MILDKEMNSLGFYKDKVYIYKKETGISSFCWRLSNGFTMSIEKDLSDDFCEDFLPTFRFQNFIYYFDSINELDIFLRNLKMI